jgi:hypothetical protein
MHNAAGPFVSSHAPASSLPRLFVAFTALGTQVPFAIPVSAFLHDEHAPVHASAQQNPSEENVLLHLLAVVSGSPVFTLQRPELLHVHF